MPIHDPVTGETSKAYLFCVLSNFCGPFEVVTFFWTPRPGGEPFYGEVQQGAARQGRGPVHQIRALRRGRDTRTRLSQQGDWIGYNVLDWFMRDMTTKELIIMADPNRPRHYEEEFKRRIVQS